MYRVSETLKIVVVQLDLWFISRTDLSVLENGLSSLCHTWELDDDLSHLCATLENLTMICRLCPATISQRLWNQNSNPICNSSGCVMYPNPTREFASRSYWIRAHTSWVRLSWALFDIVFGFLIERKWLQENIEKFMMLNRRRRWFHSSRVKLPSVKMSASWFLVSTYLIWILGSKIDPVKQPIQSNSAGSWHVSHRRTSALYDHFDHNFVISKMYKWASNWEELAFVTTWSTFDNSSTSRLPCFLEVVLGFVLRISLRQWFLAAWPWTFSLRQRFLTAWCVCS